MARLSREGFVDFKVVGDLELEAALKKLPLVAQKKVFRPALRAAARPILVSAKARVPVKTGKLRRSLRVRSIRRTRKRIGVKVVSFFVGEAFYGGPVEFGHFAGRRTRISRRNQSKGRAASSFGETRIWVKPQPFLRPALDENRERSKGILRKTIHNNLNKVAKRLSRKSTARLRRAIGKTV